MNNRQQLLTAATAFTLLAIGGPAVASDNSGYPFDKDVTSCLKEVEDHADYSDATRVRHAVVILRSRLTRHVFSITTEVFTESNEVAAREYDSYCVAKGDDKPVKFRISEPSV